MSIERQPAALTVFNLRSEVSEYQKNKARQEPQKRKGLLTSNKVLQSRKDSEDTMMSEAEKVLAAMAAIREGMSFTPQEDEEVE
mgnify:CR=1 FL=1|tara:strand:+ start:305 stop:556 length:252 start_codon:yes stop_codon:yes gene_type:complete